MSYWAARLTTVAWRTSSNSGSSPVPARWRSKNTPSRRPASVTSIASKPPASSTDWTTTAPARIRSARDGLMPGTFVRSSGGSAASSSTSASSASRRSTNPCTPNSGMPASRCAAAARLRIVPPMPTIREPALASHGALSSSPATCSRSSRSCLGLAGLSSGRKRSVIRTAPSGQELELARVARGDADELHRAAAEVERDPVGQRRRVDRGQVAVARLLLARQHAHPHPDLLGAAQ